MPTPAPKEDAARPAGGGFKSLLITALVVLNTALAGSLLLQLAPSNTAEAQARQRQQGVQQPAPRPSDYLMIPARPVGLNQDIVYVLDTANGDLLTMGYDQNTGRIDFLPPLRLNAVFERAAR